MISYTDELRHSGTKGMRWGTRKYRNYDGTLTPAGKERYNYGSSDGKSKTVKATRSERKVESARAAKKEAQQAAKEAKQAAEELRRERQALEEAKRQQAIEETQRRSSVSSMSNEELAAKIERLRLEQSYNSLVNPARPKEPSRMEKLATFGKYLKDIGDGGKAIAQMVNEINKFKSDTKSSDKKPEEKKPAVNNSNTNNNNNNTNNSNKNTNNPPGTAYYVYSGKQSKHAKPIAFADDGIPIGIMPNKKYRVTYPYGKPKKST